MTKIEMKLEALRHANGLIPMGMGATTSDFIATANEIYKWLSTSEKVAKPKRLSAARNGGKTHGRPR